MSAATRRAALGAILAAPFTGGAVMALPSGAGTLPGREAQFLALAPRILPLAKALNAAALETHRLYVAADNEAGPLPKQNDESARRGWIARGKAARGANGYHDAWEAMNAADKALTALVDGFDRVEMTTLPAILLKALLSDLGEWWRESVADDLQRYAEAVLCA